MRNLKLANLNFRELLNYGGQPIVKSFYYDSPLNCIDYCILCEQRSVFPNQNDCFDQMSHGCDTSDYETLIGELKTDRIVNFPILFLLENPGGDNGNGEIVPYKGYAKQPPINHYYWADIDDWPTNADNLKHYYGPYFAYLMKKFGLKNVYITNLIKCNVIKKEKKNFDYRLAQSLCTENWLKKEIEIFSPKIIFSFGNRATDGYKEFKSKFGFQINSFNLYHPEAITHFDFTLQEVPSVPIPGNGLMQKPNGSRVYEV